MPSRKLSNFEISQIVHYGARVTGQREEDGKTLTHEAIVIRDTLRLGDMALPYVVFTNLERYMQATSPETFVKMLLEDIGIVDRFTPSSELTILSGIAGDTRRKGSIRRIPKPKE